MLVAVPPSGDIDIGKEEEEEEEEEKEEFPTRPCDNENKVVLRATEERDKEAKNTQQCYWSVFPLLLFHLVPREREKKSGVPRIKHNGGPGPFSLSLESF